MQSTDELITRVSTEGKVGSAFTPLTLFARWLGGSALVLLLMLCCFGLRPDLSAKLMDPLYLTELIILLLMMVCMAFTAACLSFPDMYQKHWALYLPPVSALAFFATLGLIYAESPPVGSMPEHGMECLLCIMLMSVLPAAWMFVLLKKQASTNLKLAGAVSVMAAFSAGAFALRLSEQTDHLPHLIVWHYLPMLAFALIGSWLGQKLLKW